MSSTLRSREQILQKLGITELNTMQEAAIQAIHQYPEVVLLSPTGTGKTLAFLLPLVAELHADNGAVQAIVLVPSRELAIQIEQVLREMGSGHKANAVYGGRAFSKDLQDLSHPPAVLIGTPGRVADHLRRETFGVTGVTHLVLDEFDKSLEVGFEQEMSAIVASLPAVRKKVLTSATEQLEVPDFVGLRKPQRLSFLEESSSQLEIKQVFSPTKDKLNTLVETLHSLGNAPGIVFCNFKDTIEYVSDALHARRISHCCFHGGMEQQDRERALTKFRNGTHQIIVATDLAARGLDIPELGYIVHYQLPHKLEEFTHRNGRTARMHSTGTAYVLHWEREALPEFMGKLPTAELVPAAALQPSPWRTLLVSGGRKDKISKGDVAGMFFKVAGLDASQLGIIELKQDCAFVAVHADCLEQAVERTNNQRLKKRKVRVYEV